MAFIGDDLTDVVVMRRVGLAIATANARPEVKRVRPLRHQRGRGSAGGTGAVREVAELLLKAPRLTGTRFSRSTRWSCRWPTRKRADDPLRRRPRRAPPAHRRHRRRQRRHHLGRDHREPASRTHLLRNRSAGEPGRSPTTCARCPWSTKSTVVKTFQKIYGKRIIIMGGGAQVGQVAIGAISEADRHNIRGEHISVDTIPLVGEQALADAVRAVARLPRARALVLAGSLMGGDIEQAVREVREQGLLVISLNMAGSVPDAADLVVTDPVQAGVMAVMAVADTAKFTVERLKRRGLLSFRQTTARGARTPAAVRSPNRERIGAPSTGRRQGRS